MFFGKGNDSKKNVCSSCKSKVSDDFSYCPYCGRSLMSKQEKADKYGLLGSHDGVENGMDAEFGMMDRMISSLLQNFMKGMDKQIAKELQNASVTPTPNGIRIEIGKGNPVKRKSHSHPKVVKRELTDEQMQRISELPRKQAKTQIKRYGDKVVYELNTPGVVATDDVFVSRLESGYEVKALGEESMYVNTLPISLPIKSVMLEKNKIVVEFLSEEQ